MIRRQPPPDWVEQSSPGHNRPLVPRVERLARGLRVTAARLKNSVDLPFDGLYRPSRAGLGFTLVPSDVARRSAWALIGEWLVAASVGAPCATDGLRAAHEWFWQGSGQVLGSVPDVDVALGLTDGVELRALMPYLLDPMAAATRRDILNAQSTADERRARKAAGTYYTPGDVAYLMVQRLIPTIDAGIRHLWLDPAHGSGVFLRAVLTATYDHPEARSSIYGIDLDPIAAETTSFVLTAEDLAHSAGGPPPWERWHCFRRNLATGDALLIDTTSASNKGMLSFHSSDLPLEGHPLGRFYPWRLESVFPETANRGFARVVANPPYAPLRRSAASTYVSRLHPVTGSATSQDVSPVFVELCTNLLAEDGALAIVLPLSVVSSTRSPFPELRRHLTRQAGCLEMLSFDRAPDALFGDDIKTRNAIIHLDRGVSSALKTSPLYRWTSQNRKAALSNIPVTSITDLYEMTQTVPKIGRDWERELLLACAAQQRRLEQWYSKRQLLPLSRVPKPAGGKQSDMLALAPTAYNFLGVVRDPYQAVIDGHDSQNNFSILHFPTEQYASAAYSLLNSRLAFWLWHVTGDGFHVTGELHRRIPVPTHHVGLLERLADLGDRLWKTAHQNALVSHNRGRATVAYPTWPYADLVDEIDAVVGTFLGIDYAVRLAAWYEQLVVVDIDSERRNLIQRRRNDPGRDPRTTGS